MIARAFAVLPLFGCNSLLDLGEPTLDPTRPSCATGWTYRVPVDVTGSTMSLTDHQVTLSLDSAALIDAGKLQPDAADLRFTAEIDGVPLAHTVERGLGGADTRIWIKATEIPTRATTLYMHYGNPLAESWIENPFERDIVANASFETFSGWTIEPSQGPPAAFLLGNPGWFSHGVGSLAIDEHVNGERATTSRSAISQPMTFPLGSNYVIRFDVNVVAASNDGVNGSNNGAFLITLGNGITNLWALSGDHGNITGVHLDEETHPIGPGSVPFTLEARVTAGTGPGYAKGFVDNLRVRKHAMPEPTTTVGDEQALCDR